MARRCLASQPGLQMRSRPRPLPAAHLSYPDASLCLAARAGAAAGWRWACCRSWSCSCRATRLACATRCRACSRRCPRPARWSFHSPRPGRARRRPRPCPCTQSGRPLPPPPGCASLCLLLVSERGCGAPPRKHQAPAGRLRPAPRRLLAAARPGTSHLICLLCLHLPTLPCPPPGPAAGAVACWHEAAADPAPPILLAPDTRAPAWRPGPRGFTLHFPAGPLCAQLELFCGARGRHPFLLSHATALAGQGVLAAARVRACTS